MNKKILAIFTSVFLLAGVFTGCSSSKDDTNKTSATGGKSEATLKVGASTTPHAEILEHIKPKLKEQGINLEVVTFDDDGQLNPALDEKQIDANYFQHLPYLESVSKEKGYDFEVAGKIHIEPIGLYSNKIKSINDLKDGDKIGIPNNPSNEYRALALLEKNGLIKLKSGLANYSATPDDIAENPKHLKFVEADSAQLPRSFDDLAGAIINTNIILDAKIDPETALIRGSGDSPYANIVVVRKGDKERAEIKALITALTSDDVKSFLKEKYGSAVIPAF
ncbi:MetQ/NlpA family ABC transporter substrate-binding protein [Clostridium saccharobutylicum]|uniref:Lipoprotein n=1 Tax=Clostridium saccharobutylicum TaxID=169679 RepID=A0A1S8NDL3_CLOSA|nr:MetQ/NlpA family ABC transporter substrate-binding protein [Clostridium saccharobutylicum]OOM14361.1 methionine-binding lipoprotein MetQ precursor [Clostridium saccharobutylicum]